MSADEQDVNMDEAPAEGQDDGHIETEAPEGQEQAAEEHAEEDLAPGDEAPEGEGDWGDRVMQQEDGSVHEDDEAQDGDENHDDENHDDENHDEDGEAPADGDGDDDAAEGDAEGNGAPEGEEYEVVDELEDDIDDAALDEMERETRESDGEEKDGEKGEGDEKDKEKKEKTRATRTRHPFFIPTVYEYKNELRKQMVASTVLMGPVTFDDLSNEKIVGYIHKTQKVAVKFGKSTPTEDFKGYLELVFFSESEAAECSKDLEGHREDFSVQHTHRDNHSADISTIKEHGDLFTGKSGDTTVVIPDIPTSTKEEDISSQIPEAKQVFIPMALQYNRQKRYAYIELADEDTARSIVGKEYKIEEEDYKVWRLESIPSYMSVLKQVSNLRYNQMMNQSVPLDAGQRTQLFKLSMSVTHYMRTDYLERKALDDLKTAAEPLRRLLRVDAQRRSSRGRTYRTTGYKGTRGRATTYRSSDTRYGRGANRSPAASNRGSTWQDRRPTATKRRYDDYEASYSGGAYADKRPRSDYRDDNRSRESYREDYGDGYQSRHRDNSGSYRDDNMGDLETRQAVDLLMGLTSMLKGRSGSTGASTMPRESPRRVSTRGMSSPRGSSSNYRGSSSNYRGSSSSYRGSSSRGGGSSYRGSSYRGARGSSSSRGGGYSSRY